MYKRQGHNVSDLPNLKRNAEFVPTMVEASDLIIHRQKAVKIAIEEAKVEAEKHHKQNQEYKNRNRTSVTFPKGSILFHKDTSKAPTGTLSKPLKNIYHKTPLVCMFSNEHSSQVLRPLDGVISWYCNDSLKEYKRNMRENFPELPEEILKIFEINHQNWTQSELDCIADHSQIEIMPPISMEALEKDFPFIQNDDEQENEELSLIHI